MNADPKLDAPLWRQTGVALEHSILHLDGAAHRIDDASKLDDGPIAGPLDDAAMMHSDDRVNEIATEGSEPRQDSVLIGARKPRIADDIRY
jgi:hypothetical protein